MKNQLKTWSINCEYARDHVLDVYALYPRAAGDAAIEMATELRSVAHYLSGIACPHCQGAGERAYSSTSTWRGGVGGQQMTVGVCDRCWGTGRTDRSGPDLRRMSGMRHLEPWEALTIWLVARGWGVQRIQSKGPIIRARGPHGVEVDVIYGDSNRPDVMVRVERGGSRHVRSVANPAQTIPHAIAEVISMVSARHERTKRTLQDALNQLEEEVNP
jgi:hypothetical protein